MKKDTLTIQINTELKREFLETAKKRNDEVNRLFHRFIQAYVFDRPLEERLNLYRTVEQIAQASKLSYGHERLPGGITVAEYDRLSDKDEAALWNQAYSQLLDIEEAEAEFHKEDISNVITSRQRRDSDQFKRLLELRPKQATHDSGKKRR
jgi:hypothetical protein